jgi:hypothetical protein
MDDVVDSVAKASNIPVTVVRRLLRKLGQTVSKMDTDKTGGLKFLVVVDKLSRDPRLVLVRLNGSWDMDTAITQGLKVLNYPDTDEGRSKARIEATLALATSQHRLSMTPELREQLAMFLVSQNLTLAETFHNASGMGNVLMFWIIAYTNVPNKLPASNDVAAPYLTEATHFKQSVFVVYHHTLSGKGQLSLH